MAKKMMAESKEDAERKEEELKQVAAQPFPECTFTESEVQKVADFVNHMYLNAELKGTMSAWKKINQMFNDIGQHVKKIEGYIFEHKRTAAAKKAVE